MSDKNEKIENFLTEDQINKITDFMVGLDLLAERDLILNDINNIDDIKRILQLKYHPKHENITISKETDLYKTYPVFMKNISRLSANLKEYIELPNFKREIGEIYKISESQIDSKTEELDKMIEIKEFPILTAGEAKAGKSTFINLLLGTNLLPMDIVTCTRLICEIRSSDKKTVTFIRPNGESIIKHLESENQKEIDSIVKQESNLGCNKAIYEYPVKFLKNYTYLVDSPGIGDTFLLESMAFDYINKYAPAFVFVLNATNSYGLNIKARELIEKAKQDLTNETNKYITDLTNMNQVKEHFFQYHKAIFILNHWDTVRASAQSKEELEEVRRKIIEELKYIWHESVEENEQIFFISARQANEWQKQGILQTEIINIRKCIEKLIVNLYQKNAENSLELLNLILGKLEKNILQKINTIVDQKYCLIFDQNNAKLLCQKLENALNEIDSRKNKIREQLIPRLETMAKLLTEHLKSKSVENRIFEIVDKKIKTEENIDLVIIVFRKILETELYTEIIKWEKDTNQMDNLYSFLNGLFEQNMIEISKELNFSSNLLSRDSLINAWKLTNQCEITNLDRTFISKLEKVFIISTITLLFPVVALAGLLATPLIMNHLIKENKNKEEKLRELKDNREPFLRNLISNSLAKLSMENVRKSFFHTVQKKCEDHIKTFDNFISVEIKEKKQLIKEIELEKREIPEILEQLSQLYQKITNCYGEYHRLKNENETVRDCGLIVRSHLYHKLFDNQKRITKSIVTGKYSVIFKNEHHPNVVFKTYNANFINSNARFQMQEINLLHKAPFDYILRCKHIFYLSENQIMLVLDKVDCNLKQYISENQELIPGSKGNTPELFNKAFRFILNVEFQICKGLEYIHSYEPRFVHPDLRIDTILVRKTDLSNDVKIFICDACANLPTQRMYRKSGSDASTAIQISTDMGGYTKENIFRLGSMFHTLAYFEKVEIINQDKKKVDDVFSSIKDLSSITSLESDYLVDWTDSKYNILPATYNKLIKLCLSKKPENRPNIGKCISMIQQMEKKI